MKNKQQQQEIENKRFQFWKKWSCASHTEEELEEMLRRAPDAVCISFICRNSQLSGEFIERMMALTCPLVCKETPEEDLEEVKKILIEKNMSPSGNECSTDQIEIYSDKRTFLTRDGTSKARIGSSTGNAELGRYSYNTAGLVDRLDWYYISMFQKLSEDFIRKYIFRLNLRQLLGYQKMPLKLRLEIQQVCKDARRESEEIQMKKAIQYKAI